MLLRPVPYLTHEDRAKLRPKVGDTVEFEGRDYIVTEAGLKYVHMKDKETGRPGLAKITDVFKKIVMSPKDNEDGAFMEMNFDAFEPRR